MIGLLLLGLKSGYVVLIAASKPRYNRDEEQNDFRWFTISNEGEVDSHTPFVINAYENEIKSSITTPLRKYLQQNKK